MNEMPADQQRIHDPNLREHYVYRLLGKRDRLLYIGCSMNLPLRISEHKRNARFGHLIGRVEKFGPYSFREARDVEAAWIRAAQPPFNTEYTHGHRRGVALSKQGRVA